MNEEPGRRMLRPAGPVGPGAAPGYLATAASVPMAASVSTAFGDGGPFRVASMVDGLETVLVRNERWWGTPAALDELRLVVVPDQRIQFELFERGELDVLAPLPTSGRSAIVADLAAASVVSAPGEGWWFGLTIDPSEVNRNDRLALQNAADAEAWVGALLKDEAVHVTSLGGTPVDVPFRGPDEVSNPISLVAPTDLPLIGLAQRAVLLPVRDDGGLVPELREGISLDAGGIYTAIARDPIAPDTALGLILLDDFAP